MKRFERTEWAVRHPDGTVEVIDPVAANQVYRSSEQAAHVRAKVLNGIVWRRKIVTEVSDWGQP